MRQHTIHTVSELVREQWESDFADKVADALRPFDGKMVTTRMLAKLPGGADAWRLRRQYGMTHLETTKYDGGYLNGDGLSILLYHSEQSQPLDLRKVMEDHNPAYWDARRKRNHARMELINTREALQALADAMNAAEQAAARLEQAAAQIDRLTDYDELGSPDRYDIMRACGLLDTNSQTLLNSAFKRQSEPEPVEA